MTMATDRPNPDNGDPFERALAREEGYRQRRSRDMFLPTTVFRMFKWLAFGFAAAWGGLLAIHWTLFSDPRWLAVMHTMVYGIMLLYFATMAVAFTVMRRKPEAFGFVDEQG